MATPTTKSTALRPGYKQTEVGVIPEDWKCSSLDGICGMKSGVGITAEQIDDFSKYPCYGGNGLRGFTDRFTHDGKHPLVGRQGALCGNVVWAEGQFFASEHAIVVTTSPQTDSRWLCYVLGQMRLNQFAESSAQPGLSVSKILKLRLAAPSVKLEQSAIAEALTDADALIESLQKLITKKRDLKQAAMQQLLTGKTRLSGFHGTWDVRPLHSYVRSHNSGIYKKSTLYGQGCNIVGVSDLYGIEAVDGQAFAQVPLLVSEQAKHTLRVNDLLYGESSLVREGIARTVYVTERGAGTAFAWHTRRYSVDQRLVTSPFLYYYLQGRAARKHMIDQSIQTAITGINTAAYFDCPIATPSVAEQTAIAEVLSDMDSEIEALEAKLAKARLIKQGMMQELLTGRIRLV